MEKFIKQIDWEKVNGLVPAIVQDINSRVVLMLGYMSPEALERTIFSQRVCFYSRSRKILWLKGETSGNFLNAKNMRLDCDNDTLLVQVVPEGHTCHTGQVSCFDNVNTEIGTLIETLNLLFKQRSSDVGDSEAVARP